MENNLANVLEKFDKRGKIIIVGAGLVGQELYNILYRQNIKIYKVYDNSKEKIGKLLGNIRITVPQKDHDESCLYIITTNRADVRQSLYKQLQELGIDKKNINIYIPSLNYDIISSLKEEEYKEAISELFFRRFGYEINWENPKTYNEKINWEKLNVKDPMRTRLADKYLVREWVKEQIGEEHLTNWYGVWNNAYDINFDELPSQFVLKTNNGSARNIIVKDKTKLNIDETVKQLNMWKERNHAFVALELHYKDIEPKIICEEYLEGLAENVYDYNIYCFGGEPVYIWCINGSHRVGCKASFYDLNWKMQPFSYGYPKDPVEAPRPKDLDEMLHLSRILSKNFKHVRVDWYNMPDGRVLFGEMTFATWAGLRKFEPKEYDALFGDLIK